MGGKDKSTHFEALPSPGEQFATYVHPAHWIHDIAGTHRTLRKGGVVVKHQPHTAIVATLCELFDSIPIFSLLNVNIQ